MFLTTILSILSTTFLEDYVLRKEEFRKEVILLDRKGEKNVLGEYTDGRVKDRILEREGSGGRRKCDSLVIVKCGWIDPGSKD